MASPGQSSLEAVATEIIANARALDGAAAARGLPVSSLASLDEWSLSDLSLEEEIHRRKLIDGCHNLKLLATGPVGQFYDVCFNFTDALSLRFIHENSIATHIPEEGAITFSSLALATNLEEVTLRRFLYHAMFNGFTQEAPQPGYVSHTAASRLWKRDQGMRDTIGFLLDDIAPGSRFVLQAHSKWPGSAEPNETGFNIAEDTSDPFYVHIAKDKARSRRFGNGMRHFAHADSYSFDIRHLINGYPWSSIDRPGSIFVDVGGGHGTVSRALHDSTQHLCFVVQDLPETISEGQASLPAQYSDRISFMSHDFFRPQPVLAADLYFFRWILHNWADVYAEKIIHQIVAVMKPGSKILIQEQMPDAVADTSWSAKSKRNLDMVQATGWNSLERTLPDWQALFAKVDSRLVFCGAQTPKGSVMTLIEAELMHGASSK